MFFQSLSKNFIQNKKPGFILMIAVVVIGSITMNITLFLASLSTGSYQNNLISTQRTRAEYYAQACAQEGLLALRGNSAYSGNQMLTFTDGSCQILSVFMSGSSEHTLNIVGKSSDSSQKLQIVVSNITTSPAIKSWQEVADF